MAASMNLAITPDLAELINEQVSIGAYPTANDVVRAGLSLLAAQELPLQAELDQLSSVVALGTSQLEAGEATYYGSGREVAAKIRSEGMKLHTKLILTQV